MRRLSGGRGGVAAAWLVRRLLDGGRPRAGRRRSATRTGPRPSLEVGSPERELLLADRRATRCDGRRRTGSRSGELLVEHALLEGDFVLRSGRRSTYYLDKYRFETQPELLRQLGERLAAACHGGRA